jgi:hypothetical protein
MAPEIGKMMDVNINGRKQRAKVLWMSRFVDSGHVIVYKVGKRLAVQHSNACDPSMIAWILPSDLKTLFPFEPRIYDGVLDAMKMDKNSEG